MRLYELKQGKTKILVKRKSKSSLWKSLTLAQKRDYIITDVTPSKSKIR
jgi:hypothetical protein